MALLTLYRLRFLVIALAVLLLPWCAIAAEDEEPSEAAAIEGLDTQVLKQQKKMHRIKRGIQGQQDRIRQSTEKEHGLLSELENIDNRILNQRKKISTLRQELLLQEERIRSQQKEIDHLASEKEEIRKHVEKRLAAYYRMGPVGVMNVMFSSRNLPDLLNLNEYFQRVLQYDNRIINNFRERLSALQEAGDRLQQEKSRMVEVIVDVKNQEERQAATRNERLELLSRVKTEKKLYRQALNEMEKAATQLTSTMTALKEKAATLEQERSGYGPAYAKKRRPANLDFAAQKGVLEPPVSGKIITTFGKNTDKTFGITTFASGIDIVPPKESEIRAIYHGSVVYAGSLRGYGNLIIIDHGHQYYSLISRAAKLFKQEGDKVLTGDIIGVTGIADDLTGQGLHVEIRLGTDPLDPLDWLNRETLVIQQHP